MEETQQQNSDTPQEQAPAKQSKPHRRRIIIIVLVVAIITLLIGLVVWSLRRANYTRQFTIEGWHAIAKSSDEISGITKGDASLSKASDLATALRKFDGAVKDQKVTLQLIPTFLNDRSTIHVYKDFITTMGDYSQLVAGMSDDVSAISDEDITSAKHLATKSEAASTTTKSKLGYLSETINRQLFAMPPYLESLKKLSDEAKAKELADAKSQKEAAQQDALNEQLVALSINGFMDGFVAGDATKMKRYMTTAFIKEYNFDSLTASQRQYIYPDSYRLISTTKKADGSYDVQINILNKYRNAEAGSTNQYTQTMTYNLVYVASSARWLVNFEKGS